MRHPATRRLGALVVLAGLLGGLLPSATAVLGGGPVTYQYPSSTCPTAGDHGLQDCIDGAAPGDTIHLAAEVLDADAATIDKSLTITGSGPQPFPRLLGLQVVDGGPSSSIEVTIRDVRLTYGLRVRLDEGSGHTLLIDGVAIGQGSSETSVEMIADVPSDITLRRSRIRGADLDQQPVVLLTTGHASGVVGFHLTGTTIHATGDPESGAGVEVSVEGEGTVRASLDNNVIHDVGTCNCGAVAGITFVLDGTGHVIADVVGNTLHDLDVPGINLRNDLASGGRVDMRVFGNILSRVRIGISLDAGVAGTLGYQGGYNDVFRSGGVSLDGKAAGPGNVAVDPRFVKPAANDFRLRADSPVIDRMPFCPPTGVENLDAAGKGRLAGTRVDLGAFERGASAPTGVARTGGAGPDSLIGTSGADILCGLGGPDGLAGLGGPDALDGGRGDDDLFGNGGGDVLLGGDGRDTLCATDGIRGNDRSDGGAGVDGGRSDPGDTRVRIEGGADCSPT